MKKLKVRALLRKFRDAVVSAYVEGRKRHFYTGTIFSFLGLLFLLLGGIGYITFVFFGIGFCNLAIWILVRWHLYKLHQKPLKDKNAENHNI